MREVNYFRQNLGLNMIGVEQLYEVMYGEGSDLFGAFRKISKTITYGNYCLYGNFSI
jgi:hypothetical protein